MSFDSLEYLIFLPAVALIYRFLPGKWRWLPLLGASWYFYASWNVALTGLIMGVSAVSWCAGMLIARTDDRRRQRLFLAADMVVCLGLLCYFKYFGFLTQTLSAIAQMLGGRGFDAWTVILPVGVSFYTFQAMSYVVDVYRGDMPAERHFGYFALYVSFFPQLVAGPIERATTLLPQLHAHRSPTVDDLHMGLRLLMTGLFRKVVAADFAARFVDRVYAMDAPDGFAVLAGTLFFALQIYCDFSGYSEIAAGSARFMGVRLMRNFDRPYRAASIREFWRRWHISLSTWFTDYVYIPLGGNRHGRARQISATLVVFALSGLWHGAAWTFVVWGLLHGAMMTADILLRSRLPKGRVGRALMALCTFAAVTLTWIFFRAESLSHAGMLLHSLFSGWDVSLALTQLGVSAADVLQIAGTLLLFPLLHRVSEENKPVPDVWLILLTMAIGFSWLTRLESGTVSTFIYFQF